MAEDSIEPHSPDGTTKESKLRGFLGILRRFVGVKDIANVRFSLPAHLLEPIPNLEYWNYLDRPDAFLAIGQENDPVERMLGVLRFYFTKDLKFVKSKPCKPYNSVLGEVFRCHWDVQKVMPSFGGLIDSQQSDERLAFITEQTSHHPPVSAFYVENREQQLTMCGMDQLSARFTGTSIRIHPGEQNMGMFIRVRKHGDEEYRLTHPSASIGGFLRGSLHVSIHDVSYVICHSTKLKAITEYLENGWISKGKNKVQGLIYAFDQTTEHITKLQDVPKASIVARFHGCWDREILYTIGEGSSQTLLNVEQLEVMHKKCLPIEQQLPHESRKMWKPVTEAIEGREYSLATKRKQHIEDQQRKLAATRSEIWKSRYFETPALYGKPTLTNEGRDLLNRELQREVIGADQTKAKNEHQPK